jgi:predicted nucleic acid-binding protein
MTPTFVDTSALLALLSAHDPYRPRALEIWKGLNEIDAPLHTSNYVLVETTALAQARLGLDAVRMLRRDLRPAMLVHWVDRAEHEVAEASLLAANRRGLSLVDCVSFAIMSRLGLTRCFAFDAHFAEQGFEVL